MNYEDKPDPYDTKNLIGIILKNGEVVVVCGEEEDPKYFVYKNRDMFRKIVRQINGILDEFERKVN